VAGITVIAWTLAMGFNVEVIKRVATVLVISCPHALGLAVPLVVAITTTVGASKGVLIRDRLALEAARELNMVMFDKTGTLTTGKQGVVDMAVVEDWDKEQALALAAAAEGDSEHMIARGIREAAQKKDLSLPKVTHFEALKGRGVKAQSEGRTLYVGGPRLLEQLDQKAPEALKSFAEEAGSKGEQAGLLHAAGLVAVDAADNGDLRLSGSGVGHFRRDVLVAHGSFWLEHLHLSTLRNRRTTTGASGS
jgi:Cu2+-exporting ATPase